MSVCKAMRFVRFAICMCVYMYVRTYTYVVVVIVVVENMDTLTSGLPIKFSYFYI